MDALSGYLNPEADLLLPILFPGKFIFKTKIITDNILYPQYWITRHSFNDKNLIYNVPKFMVLELIRRKIIKPHYVGYFIINYDSDILKLIDSTFGIIRDNITDEVIDSVLEYDNLEVLLWLFGKFKPDDLLGITNNNSLIFLLIKILDYGSLKIFNWMSENYSFKKDIEFIKIPIINGNIPILEWMYEKKWFDFDDIQSEDFWGINEYGQITQAENDLLKIAIEKGKFDVVKWLIDTFKLNNYNVKHKEEILEAAQTHPKILELMKEITI